MMTLRQSKVGATARFWRISHVHNKSGKRCVAFRKAPIASGGNRLMLSAYAAVARMMRIFFAKFVVLSFFLLWHVQEGKKIGSLCFSFAFACPNIALVCS